MLELGLRKLEDAGREGGLVSTDIMEVRRSCSGSVWRKMGISPELARDARTSRLPDGEGLGGLRESRA